MDINTKLFDAVSSAKNCELDSMNDLSREDKIIVGYATQLLHGASDAWEDVKKHSLPVKKAVILQYIFHGGALDTLVKMHFTGQKDLLSLVYATEAKKSYMGSGKASVFEVIAFKVAHFFGQSSIDRSIKGMTKFQTNESMEEFVEQLFQDLPNPCKADDVVDTLNRVKNLGVSVAPEVIVKVLERKCSEVLVIGCHHYMLDNKLDKEFYSFIKGNSNEKEINKFISIDKIEMEFKKKAEKVDRETQKKVKDIKNKLTRNKQLLKGRPGQIKRLEKKAKKAIHKVIADGEKDKKALFNDCEENKKIFLDKFQPVGTTKPGQIFVQEEAFLRAKEGTRGRTKERVSRGQVTEEKLKEKAQADMENKTSTSDTPPVSSQQPEGYMAWGWRNLTSWFGGE